MQTLILAVTPGDPAGIGPEITWKAIRSGIAKKNGVVLICVGASEPFKKLKARIVELPADLQSQAELLAFTQKQAHPTVFLIAAPTQTLKSDLHLDGYQSGWAIEKATRLVQAGICAAIVTGPISKDRLQRGGFMYPGHTEFLADLCRDSASPDGIPKVTMMLANDLLRVTLVTTHIGIHQVSSSISRENIRRTFVNTALGLRSYWGIKKPRIAFTALNPHAGEAGLFGREEIDVIEPEILSLQEEYGDLLTIKGPFPADTLFAKQVLAAKKDRWDAVICMYHDQGLIPVKALDFQRTVNVTLGLPIVRTSVDHGVGFDIAGQGVADPSSLVCAIELAAKIVRKQRSARKAKLSA